MKFDWNWDRLTLTAANFGGKTIEIHTFDIVKTCNVSPEQYDIKYNGKTYYGRLRWGYFYVAESPLGDSIYEHHFKDKWKGSFYGPDKEMKYLLAALEAIIAWEKKKARPRKKGWRKSA